MTHKTTIIRDPSNGSRCLICACGFNMHADNYEELVPFIDNHEAPIATPPPVDLRKFMSGLPERNW